MPLQMALDSSVKYEILPAGVDDAEEYLRINIIAFANSELHQTLYPKDKAHLTPPEELHRWRVQRFAANLAKKDSLNFKAVVAGQPEVIVGYSRWAEPGHFSKKTTPEITALGPIEPKPDPAAEEEWPACMDSELERSFMAIADKRRAEIWGDNANFWYLAALAVDPDYRRQGLAGMLIEPSLERADEEGLPVYLEATPEGALMYPRYGFESCGVVEVLDGRYTFTLMIRQPKPLKQ